MTRKEKVLSAALDNAINYDTTPVDAFIKGAAWADANPDINIDAFKVLESKLAIAIEALETNANEDYRGNRSSASEHSFHALAKIRGMR